MRSKRKMLLDILFLIIVFALTLYGVFHGEDLGELLQTVKKADIRWLIPGVILVIVFIWGESVIIWYLMRTFHIFLKKRICFLFSLAVLLRQPAAGSQCRFII